MLRHLGVLLWLLRLLPSHLLLCLQRTDLGCRNLLGPQMWVHILLRLQLRQVCNLRLRERTASLICLRNQA